MNPQIKKLWSQAGGHYNGGNQHTWPQYTIDDPAKFAELIVRECQYAIVSRTDLPKHERKLYNNVLKEHFGVEL